MIPLPFHTFNLLHFGRNNILTAFCYLLSYNIVRSSYCNLFTLTSVLSVYFHVIQHDLLIDSSFDRNNLWRVNRSETIEQFSFPSMLNIS
jgi:hypothetical protein